MEKYNNRYIFRNSSTPGMRAFQTVLGTSLILALIFITIPWGSLYTKGFILYVYIAAVIVFYLPRGLRTLIIDRGENKLVLETWNLFSLQRSYTFNLNEVSFSFERGDNKVQLLIKGPDEFRYLIKHDELETHEFIELQKILSSLSRNAGASPME